MTAHPGFKPFNFQRWIAENQQFLKPPVGNKEVFPGQEDFIVMVVGGPNQRTDYHVDPYEEVFYQLKGTMHVNLMTPDGPDRVTISAGQMWVLPRFMPHSPQRRANTVGLVIERRRRPGELDAFEWYCEGCGGRLYREDLAVTSIVKDLPPVFERYEARVEHRTCRGCGWVMPTRAESAAKARAS